MKQVKIGDKFILGEWEWEVMHVNQPGNTFKAKMTIWPQDYTSTLFPEEAADSLNWIIPTKEEILCAFNVDMVPCCIYGTRGVNGEIISARIEFDYLKKSVSKPTCSKAFAEAIKHYYFNHGSTEDFKKWLNDHTESET